MGDRDVFVVLFEYEPEADRRPPCSATQGFPRALTARDFDPATLRRGIAGQSAHQAFFQESGRAFCLYVVLGAHARRAALVPIVNGVLASVRIDPRAGRVGSSANGCLGRTVPDRGVAARGRGRRQGGGPHQHRRRAPQARRPGVGAGVVRVGGAVEARPRRRPRSSPVRRRSPCWSRVSYLLFAALRPRRARAGPADRIVWLLRQGRHARRARCTWWSNLGAVVGRVRRRARRRHRACGPSSPTSRSRGCRSWCS